MDYRKVWCKLLTFNSLLASPVNYWMDQAPRTARSNEARDAHGNLGRSPSAVRHSIGCALAYRLLYANLGAVAGGQGSVRSSRCVVRLPLTCTVETLTSPRWRFPGVGAECEADGTQMMSRSSLWHTHGKQNRLRDHRWLQQILKLSTSVLEHTVEHRNAPGYNVVSTISSTTINEVYDDTRESQKRP